jgi:Fe-S cluster biogenesis protein NfuA
MNPSEDKDLHRRIEAGIEEIRPFLKSDGGDCEFVEITNDYIVKIELKGMCADCNMSASTVKGGIEETIKRHVPLVKSVEAISI